MTTRYYLVPIIGNGTRQSPYRPNVGNITYVAHIPTDEKGVPVSNQILVMLKHDNHEELIKTLPEGSILLPDNDLDVRASEVEVPNISDGIERLMDENTKYGDVIVNFVNKYDPTFNLEELRKMGC